MQEIVKAMTYRWAQMSEDETKATRGLNDVQKQGRLPELNLVGDNMASNTSLLVTKKT